MVRRANDGPSEGVARYWALDSRTGVFGAHLFLSIQKGLSANFDDTQPLSASMACPSPGDLIFPNDRWQDRASVYFSNVLAFIRRTQRAELKIKDGSFPVSRASRRIAGSCAGRKPHLS
jgi:hypothetical protein